MPHIQRDTRKRHLAEKVSSKADSEPWWRELGSSNADLEAVRLYDCIVMTITSESRCCQI